MLKLDQPVVRARVGGGLLVPALLLPRADERHPPLAEGIPGVVDAPAVHASEHLARERVRLAEDGVLGREDLSELIGAVLLRGHGHPPIA